MSSRPFVFLTAGTRGDVQPILALARGLIEHGAPVRLVAPPAFGAWIQSFGVPFAPLDGNPSDLLVVPEGQLALRRQAQLLRGIQATYVFWKRARPLYARMLTSAAEACGDARAVLIGLASVWGVHVAEWLGVPCIGTFLQPVTPTEAFFSPLLPCVCHFGRRLNRLSHILAAHLLFLPWREGINAWRRERGLRPLVTLDFTTRLDQLLYGFSRHVVPAPADWPSKAVMTGYWTLLEDSDPGDFPAELEAFLQTGLPPLYITFGSPGACNLTDLIAVLIQAIEQVGMRAVISLPRGFSGPALPRFVFPLTIEVSHARLFPQLSGVVHHGGAGTTAAGLMAGLPTLILPSAVDQFFWGKRVHDLGAGPPPIPLHAVTVKRLSASLQVLQHPQTRQRVHDLAQTLKAENGVETAVHLLLAMDVS